MVFTDQVKIQTVIVKKKNLFFFFYYLKYICKSLLKKLTLCKKTLYVDLSINKVIFRIFSYADLIKRTTIHLLKILLFEIFIKFVT